MRDGVLHRACDGARAQLVAVGDLGCGDCAVRLGFDLVHRVEDERQLKVFVVGGGDRHFGSTDLAGHGSLFRRELCQSQHAVFELYDRLVVIIPTLRNNGNSSPITIAYRAIFALGQFGQQLAEIVGVRLLCAVDYVQRAGRDICGRGRLGDGEVLGFLLDDVVAACNVLDGHPAGTSVGIVAEENLVLLRVDGVAEVVLNGHVRLQRIAGVGAGCDFNRGCHFSCRDLPSGLHLAGVVTITGDGKVVYANVTHFDDNIAIIG